VDKSGFQDPYKNSFNVRHHPYNEHGAYLSEYKDATNGDLNPEDINPAGIKAKDDDKEKEEINLGDDFSHPKISEQHDNFVKKDLDARGKINNKLYKSNLHFGDCDMDYGTTYQNEHTDKGVIPKDNISNKIMMDLRSNHYELGYQGVSMLNKIISYFVETYEHDSQ